MYYLRLTILAPGAYKTFVNLVDGPIYHTLKTYLAAEKSSSRFIKNKANGDHLARNDSGDWV